MTGQSGNDWTRPEKDGWHWLRNKEAGVAHVAFFRAYAEGLWRVFEPGRFLHLPYAPRSAGDYFTYIAPIEGPRP